VKAEEIIAIGDGINDVTMVTNAGLGVAMGNSHKDLLKCAKMVIGLNSDDGLAIFLEELLAAGAVMQAKQN
jgi:hydroxymethylpyrimidine pyrophosphatase-like HAD family hydrolase